MSENLVKIDNEECIEIYDQMLTRLNTFYKEGFYSWLPTANPHLSKRLVILDEKINEVWEKCVKGEASLIMYKAGVKFYEDTVRKAMVDYA
jgi:hypothetical protein